MNNLSRILTFLAAVLLAPLAVWLLIAGLAGRQEYLALTRSGLLLVGLVGLLWGIIRHRFAIVLVSLLIILLGFLTSFRIERADPEGPARTWSFLKVGYLHRFFFAVPFQGYLLVVAGLILNGILLARGYSWRRIPGANLVFLGGALLLHVGGIGYA